MRTVLLFCYLFCYLFVNHKFISYGLNIFYPNNEHWYKEVTLFEIFFSDWFRVMPYIFILVLGWKFRKNIKLFKNFVYVSLITMSVLIIVFIGSIELSYALRERTSSTSALIIPVTYILSCIIISIIALVKSFRNKGIARKE
jgi:hypothetical protein